MRNYILKGDICYSGDVDRLIFNENAYLICEDGVSAGVYQEIPEKYQAFPVIDYTRQLIVPGLVDLHVHAPQFAYRGLGMDMELLEWLETYAFPEEAKYRQLDYANKAYDMFVHDLKYSATTRFSAFGTLHADATLALMKKLEDAGLRGYVGKVNMNRNSPDYYCEKNSETSIRTTLRWLDQTRTLCRNIKPIITPRFTPSCSDDLMEALGDLASDKGLRVQSHLSENQGEIAWVKELCTWSEDYIDTYKRPELITPDRPSIMAHCVYSDERELQIMKENNVYAAHCPQCNMNIASGIAPVRKWLDMGIHMGLGSDVAGGATLSIFRAMMEARQVSKLVWRLIDQNLKPLTIDELFWMGTKGGGEFFGKVGSFEKGYELDALVLDESRIPHPQELTLRQRLERFICLSESGDISHKYIAGDQIF